MYCQDKRVFGPGSFFLDIYLNYEFRFTINLEEKVMPLCGSLCILGFYFQKK